MRSDTVKKGSTRAAHRALFYAMGYTPEDLKKPLIGVVNAFNEIIPGHIHLRTIAEAVKTGVSAAGGTPMAKSAPACSHRTLRCAPSARAPGCPQRLAG